MEDKSKWKEQVLFYITGFFLLLATFSFFAFLFLVPFFIEPALATLNMDFDPTPALCVTVENRFVRGLQNCSWSSCREGCTKEVFECTQLRVKYRPLTQDDSFTDLTIDPDLDPSFLENWFEGQLQPNVKGCGYPPDVDCGKFMNEYATVGSNFSCYYSVVNRNLVITHLDIEQVRSDLVYCLAVPIVCFSISVFYLIYAYFKIYVVLPPPPTVCAIEDEDPKTPETDSGMVASPLGFAARFEPNFPQPENSKNAMRRAKSAMHGSLTKETETESGLKVSRSMGDSRKIQTRPFTAIPGPTDSRCGGPFKGFRTSPGSPNKTFEELEKHFKSPTTSE